VFNVLIEFFRYDGELLGHEPHWQQASATLASGDKDDVAGEDDAVTDSWQSDCPGASESEIMGLMRQSQGTSLAAAKALLRQAVWTALDDGGSDREHFELSVLSLETVDRSDTCSSDS
jgi:hypothetical protein